MLNIIFYLIAYLFSGVYEHVTAKSRQILLKHRANFIADYEALYHIHFSKPELEPKYIYYLGQPKIGIMQEKMIIRVLFMMILKKNPH